MQQQPVVDLAYVTTIRFSKAHDISNIAETL